MNRARGAPVACLGVSRPRVETSGAEPGCIRLVCNDCLLCSTLLFLAGLGQPVLPRYRGSPTNYSTLASFRGNRS